MPRKKQKQSGENKLTDRNNSKKQEKERNEEDLLESIENEEQAIEKTEEDELNIDSLTDFEDLDELEEDYSEFEDTEFFMSEDDLIMCPGCGEVIEAERLKLLEECPSCGLSISEFDEFEKYDSIYKESDENEEW
ncbi:MAG: hypothetical protein RMJ51_03250 [Candidatus Calescibacterium sp.]|nr:hypothetical protein [Candidatus Calescibacterium sp.]MCX7972835.1 hypothetical protein [bacterium]MDW8195243.1 hypothetical protein [Candidatus Calescibacterium sp.]